MVCFWWPTAPIVWCLRPLFYAVHSVFPADHRDDGREYRHLAAGNYCVGRRIAHGQLDLAVGAALGSNITNILLILGWRRWFVHLPCIPMFYVANCH
ncbi:hypothetical protein JS561_10585 [Salmonella enterica subsp. enterica serovar Infantis]|nr:hypothetical protein JS561_10585 [Salmonella enterica subsp. enterica serovar Infantis]